MVAPCFLLFIKKANRYYSLIIEQKRLRLTFILQKNDKFVNYFTDFLHNVHKTLDLVNEN